MVIDILSGLLLAGGSLSPRGDWRAPSDMSARAWLDEIEAAIPRE